jgi:hypothetical protein
MNQVAFVDRCTASKELVDTLCFAFGPCLAKLRMIEDFQEELRLLPEECISAVKVAYGIGHAVGFRCAWQAARKTGAPPWCKEGEQSDEDPLEEGELLFLLAAINSLEEVSAGVIGRLEEAKRLLTKETLTTSKAFSTYCKEKCGLEPEKLVKVWYEPILADIECLKSLPDPPELDREKL